MAMIFLSYRRADGVASGARSLIYQKLEEHYGPKSVFMDVERMQVARDFRECLQEEVSGTDVMILLIGPEWERIMIERANEEADFVRIEIETALEQEKPLLPLLLGGAKMPSPEVLPESIRGFAWNHGVEIDTGRYFNEGMARLTKDMDEHVFGGELQYRPKPKLIAAVAAGTLIVFAIIGLLVSGALTGDKIAGQTEDIVKAGEQTASNTKKIQENTERTADAIEKVAKSFEELSKSSGIIATPAAPHEFYHNARVYELGGDYAAARQAYLGYFRFKEDKLDPYLRYLDFLKVQEGREGARETFAVVARGAEGFLADYASALLHDRERRLPLLDEFKKAHPGFAPVHYQLSLEYSADRLGSQSIADRRAEKEHLEEFVKQDKAGELVKYFVDKEVVTTWRNDANKRLEVANSVAEKMLENPVNVTWQSSNQGWMGYIQVAEPALDLWWKMADMADFKQNPRTRNIDTRTGQPMPNGSFMIPSATPATTVEVKYTDRSGTERGPFKFEFTPKTESWANDINILNQFNTSWLSYRDWDGKLLVYFTQIMSYRGAISKVEYGIDKEKPDLEWDFPTWEKPGVAPITEKVKVYRDIPKDTKFMTVRLTYKDGAQSDVMKFAR